MSFLTHYLPSFSAEEALSESIAPPAKRPQHQNCIIISSDSEGTESDTCLEVNSEPHHPDMESESAVTSTAMKDFSDWRWPVTGKQASLNLLGWKRWQPGEQEAYVKAEAAKVKVIREEICEDEQKAKEEKKAYEKELAAARSRRYWKN